ncbi:mitochondrial carrier domain-containing protein [Podospora fimiseda]|uniref:Mitochondrial carrier domain-containing protein n=1 Tax=Podospora fimiseda TaxID=252190 RepID=A0AAN7H8A5_9PEZI|nr:mitochondrial carrier domain-containing protein [Podospora fimiseda]
MTLLPSIGHAASGATGTIISTLLTYPLDLINTRLKVQRQLKQDGSITDEDGYDGVIDAFLTIYKKEGGGLRGFFDGLETDLVKSAADSFLFFLFYTWFRTRRLVGRNNLPYLKVLEELAVGASAGACAKLFTTPVSNVVTRRQTASFKSKSGSPERQQTFAEIIREIRRERGTIKGLWAGYSASLVLTLNPSLTFFLQQILKRLVVADGKKRKWDDLGPAITFLLAATSKVGATAVTYPFSIAKARIQVSSADKEKGIFGMVGRIYKTEGVKALYDGIGGELLKGFFNHGTTMLSKDLAHGFIVRGYFVVLGLLVKWPGLKGKLIKKWRELKRKEESEFVRGGRFVKDILSGGLGHGKGVVIGSVKG